MAKNTILCGLVFLAALLLLPVQAVDAEREIVRAEAKHLVKIWLASQGYDTRSWRFVLDADPDQNEFPSFYFFSANFVQEQSAPTLGHFAVNRRSADLWDWELCRRIQEPAIQSTQKSLRKKLRLTDRDYRSLSKIAPCSGPM